MNLIKPKKLKLGDTISIIAPAGNVDTEKIAVAKLYFENKGYKVNLGKNLKKSNKYLAGTDEERLDDIHSAFEDKNTDAIICARGGYGTIRLVNKIDYNLIRNNPKIFCGYSDITALSAMILKNSGLITFSGAMAQGDFGDNEINPYTKNSFFKTLSSDTTIIEPYHTQKVYKSGNCEGFLFGGNLATLVSLCGLDFIPDEKFILFAEDINEPVYKIDKYFRQLLNIKKFRENLSGIILGDFIDTDNENWLDSLFFELSSELNIPIFGNYPFSHSEKKATVPYGAKAFLKDGILHVENY